MDFDLPGYLAELSNYELLESYYLIRGSLVSDVTVFMTILFAYVTAAYFVSAKLTRFQAISISGLYSVFALYMVSSAYSAALMLSVVGEMVSGIDSSWEPTAVGIILFISWIFSLILFVQARKMGTSNR